MSRRVGRPPRRQVPLAGHQSRWLPAPVPVRALAWLALLLAYAAALAAIASGTTTLSLGGIFSDDGVFPWLVYRGLFLDAGWEFGDWQKKNSTHLLDLVLSGLLFTVGSVFGPDSRGQFLFGMYATFLAWSCISAQGWVLVARQAWGREPAREAAVVLAHALPYACIAAGQEWFFVTMLWLVYHVAPWCVLPWLLWLLLRTRQTRSLAGQAGFLLALFVVTFADVLIAVWFTAPAIVALPLARVLGGRRLTRLGVQARRAGHELLRHGVPMVAVTWLGMAAADRVLFTGRTPDVSVAGASRALANFPDYFSMAVTHSAALLPVLVAFTVVAVGWPVHRLWCWWQGDHFTPPPFRFAGAAIGQTQVTGPQLPGVDAARDDGGGRVGDGGDRPGRTGLRHGGMG